MTNDTRYVLLGRVALPGLDGFRFPEGYETEEAEDALAALLFDEEINQSIDKAVAAAPILSHDEAYGD